VQALHAQRGSVIESGTIVQKMTGVAGKITTARSIIFAPESSYAVSIAE
jgi:hypothetical protein